MEIKQTKFNVPMLTAPGDAAKYQERDGYMFKIGDYTAAIHKLGKDACIVSDYRTGLKVSHEYTGDVREAAEGFAIYFEIGHMSVEKIIAAAQSFPTVNEVAA